MSNPDILINENGKNICIYGKIFQKSKLFFFTFFFHSHITKCMKKEYEMARI